MTEEDTEHSTEIRQELANRFADKDVDRVPVEEVARKLNVPNSEIREVVTGSSSYGDLLIEDGHAYVMRQWMTGNNFFKRCTRCGHEICSWDERLPRHCMKCGVETESMKPKLAGKWHHHLNIKALRTFYAAYGTREFRRQWIIDHPYTGAWGFNLAVDDITYYLIRAGLLARNKPGVYQITMLGLRVVDNLVTRSDIIKQQTEREFEAIKKTIESGEWYYRSGTTPN